MRLGIMQPYFFPYLGYFSLIEATERWIVFDTAQYIRRGWVNRNRVLTLGKDDWKYVSIPVVRAPQDTPIHEMRVDNAKNWRDELIRNLDAYRQYRAPQYERIIDFLKSILDLQEEFLAPFLVHLLQQTCQYVGIHREFEIFSKMDIQVTDLGPGKWAPQICGALNASLYVNPPGGREIFDTADFTAEGTQLRYLEPTLPKYTQKRTDFVRGLSIIDALMWNSQEDVLAMIRDYELKTQ